VVTILEIGGVWREQSFRFLSFVVGICLHYIQEHCFCKINVLLCTRNTFCEVPYILSNDFLVDIYTYRDNTNCYQMYQKLLKLLIYYAILFRLKKD